MSMWMKLVFVLLFLKTTTIDVITQHHAPRFRYDLNDSYHEKNGIKAIWNWEKLTWNKRMIAWILPWYEDETSEENESKSFLAVNLWTVIWAKLNVCNRCFKNSEIYHLKAANRRVCYRHFIDVRSWWSDSINIDVRFVSNNWMVALIVVISNVLWYELMQWIMDCSLIQIFLYSKWVYLSQIRRKSTDNDYVVATLATS